MTPGDEPQNPLVAVMSWVARALAVIGGASWMLSRAWRATYSASKSIERMIIGDESK